jgi:hypothetical protein
LTDPGERTLELPVQVVDKVEATPGPAPAPAVEEHRRTPRLPLGLWAHCQIDGVVSQQALGDLSSTGLYIRLNAAPRIGARVRVVLGLPYISGQRVCSLSGRVVWLDREGETVRGAGVQFDHETDSADHELLEGFLALWGLPHSAVESSPEVTLPPQS